VIARIPEHGAKCTVIHIKLGVPEQRSRRASSCRSATSFSLMATNSLVGWRVFVHGSGRSQLPGRGEALLLSAITSSYDSLAYDPHHAVCQEYGHYE
jgi:hypothetical protein